MSEIRMLCGGIGHGKSLWATIQGATELEKSDRFIVTNIALNLPEWAEFAHQYIKPAVNVNVRVRELTKEQARTWWLYLPGKDLRDLEEVSQRQPGAPVHSVYGTTLEPWWQRGCLYLIDEVHLLYSAREWQKSGQDVESYMSQLRKLNDDLWLITQHPGKVDKNFRRNATEWWYVRSMARARLLLGVGIPGKFRWTVYDSEPQRNDKPAGAGWFTVKNRNYGSLYRTMAGVGFAGLQSEPESQPKRRSWWVWVVALSVVVAIALFLPGGLGRLIGYAAGIAGKEARDGITRQVGLTNFTLSPGLTPPSSQGSGAQASQSPPRLETGAPGNSPADSEYVIGYTIVNKQIRVHLDSGRTVIASAVHDQYGALVDGVLVKWASRKPVYSDGYRPAPLPDLGFPVALPRKYNGPLPVGP